MRDKQAKHHHTHFTKMWPFPPKPTVKRLGVSGPSGISAGKGDREKSWERG